MHETIRSVLRLLYRNKPRLERPQSNFGLRLALTLDPRGREPARPRNHFVIDKAGIQDSGLFRATAGRVIHWALGRTLSQENCSPLSLSTVQSNDTSSTVLCRYSHLCMQYIAK